MLLSLAGTSQTGWLCCHDGLPDLSCSCCNQSSCISECRGDVAVT